MLHINTFDIQDLDIIPSSIRPLSPSLLCILTHYYIFLIYHNHQYHSTSPLLLSYYYMTYNLFIVSLCGIILCDLLNSVDYNYWDAIKHIFPNSTPIYGNWATCKYKPSAHLVTSLEFQLYICTP